MKIIFAGTPHFAARALQALMAAGHEIVLVLTQPDRPSGRGMKLNASPVKVLAQAHQLPVWQPERLKTPEQRQPIEVSGAEIMIVAAYGLIFPQTVLDLPPLGCLNIHASLLPRWRGAAPIHRALLAGDHETGITIMQMDAGLDTGDQLSTHPVPITEDDTIISLEDKLADQGAIAIVSALSQLSALQSRKTQQNADGVTYAEKLRKEEKIIDWNQPAEQIERMIRAFYPAETTLNEAKIKIWQATLVDRSDHPGKILAVNKHGIVVACGSKAIEITSLQKAGGRRLAVSEFLAGMPLRPLHYWR